MNEAGLAAALVKSLECENARVAAQQECVVAFAMATIELPEMQRALGIEPRCPEWWPA